MDHRGQHELPICLQHLVITSGAIINIESLTEVERLELKPAMYALGVRSWICDTDENIAIGILPNDRPNAYSE